MLMRRPRDSDMGTTAGQKPGGNLPGIRSAERYTERQSNSLIKSTRPVVPNRSRTRG